MVMKTIADVDTWLEPYRTTLEENQRYIKRQQTQLLHGESLDSYALGHLYFGLHKQNDGWVFREWAPNATALTLVTDATNWQPVASHQAKRLDNGVWELHLPTSALRHGDRYSLLLEWPGGSGYRIPSYATYVTQDSETQEFKAEVWQPASSYDWKYASPAPPKLPLIYEAHIGMAGDREAVSTYMQFEKDVLPRVSALGYNTIQLMAIQEHPYYASFGYHVANFFAPTSRFGTPDELKHLIDTAHGMGLRVLLDVVHSHAVKNEHEGLSMFDGSEYQYFHEGDKGLHDAWDSRVFDYHKPEVVHYLASNIRYWLDEFHFDGFRFDGVTSMLYKNHGLEQSFTSYDDYFSDNLDLDALTYLSLANQVAHQKPGVTTIAEDMSAFPGLAASNTEGGIGFDYRLSMGVPDLWIKLLKEARDEDWDLGHIMHELTQKRPEEKTISYAESHDQALVGDKTLIFRLLDQAMYTDMRKDIPSLEIDRGIALHKLIRLLTSTTTGGGYLTFMGNEFGHPEWIDFPREGNNWSYHYARRQWHLADDETLRYELLQAFDAEMVQLLGELDPSLSFDHLTVDEATRVISYQRGNKLFAFNFSGTNSYESYALPAADGTYTVVLNSDELRFGGHERVNSLETNPEARDGTLALYLPTRTALVLERQ